MKPRKRIYLYPYTPALVAPHANDYIPQLAKILGQDFELVNGVTTKGLLDLLRHLHKTDLIFFHWIEDLPSRRFIGIQGPLLLLILLLAKVRGVKIAWWIHNNHSHDRRRMWWKKQITRLMVAVSDVIGSHSREQKLYQGRKEVIYFDHPLAPYRPLPHDRRLHSDLLIWGSVSPYKGVTEFVSFAAASPTMHRYQITIAGKISSEAQFRQLQTIRTANIQLHNRKIPDEELEQLYAASRYVLFTYNAPSVLSSAALCHSLSAGCRVIGPRVGAFKELAAKGLIYSYNHFTDLPALLKGISEGSIPEIPEQKVAAYVNTHSWQHFRAVLNPALYRLCWNIDLQPAAIPVRLQAIGHT